MEIYRYLQLEKSSDYNSCFSPRFLGHCRLPPSLPPWHCEPIAVIASTAAPSVAEWAVASARGSAAAGRREPDWFEGQFAGNPHFS